MLGALICATDHSRGLLFTDLETRQRAVVCNDLDDQYAVPLEPTAGPSQPSPYSSFPP